VEDDVTQAPRTIRGWVVSGVVDLAGYVVIALLLRIWLPWSDAFLWALVGIGGWIGADVINDISRRRKHRRH